MRSLILPRKAQEVPKVVPMAGTRMMFAPTMNPSPVAPQSPSRSRLAALVALVGLAVPSIAQDAKPDQVFRDRKGKITKVVGTVTENTLDTVRLDREGKEATYDGSEVVRIVWGAVPPAYQDGSTYTGRGDFENAVARFRVAAEDASAREVVQASARLQAAEALLSWGSSDPSRYDEAASEAARFLADHASNREVPRARWIQARATWLSGEPLAAAGFFQALYDEGAGDPPTAGYDRLACLEAGMAAAQCYLAATDGDKAQELFDALEPAFRDLAGEAEDGTDARARLLAGQGAAAVGEGWCSLAKGDADAARRFFEGRVDRAELGAAGRGSARLGLAEALFQKGDIREAQVQFARASALETQSRDRTAQAMVGLASCTLQLGDSESRVRARTLLESTLSAYGDTPAAAKATEMLGRL